MAAAPIGQVLDRRGVTDAGLTAASAAQRLAHVGPNAAAAHRARFLLVLWHQLRSPLLGLLPAAALASYFVGERADAVIIAVGITPQLLLGVVSTSLAAGSRQMARRRALVRHLVCIEDLGDGNTRFTDQTGTLTQGRISFMRAIPTGSTRSQRVLRWGLLCTEAAGDGAHATAGNPLDVGCGTLPHPRRFVGIWSATPECRSCRLTTNAAWSPSWFATRSVFLDAPKPSAAAALRRLADLGITVKIVTGDNPVVAAKVCHDLGLTDAGVDRC